MKSISQALYNAIRANGSMIDAIITGTNTYNKADINSIKPYFDGDLCKSVMKVAEVELDGFYDETDINIKIGVSESGTFTPSDYIDFGSYHVYEISHNTEDHCECGIEKGGHASGEDIAEPTRSREITLHKTACHIIYEQAGAGKCGCDGQDEMRRVGFDPYPKIHELRSRSDELARVLGKMRECIIEFLETSGDKPRKHYEHGEKELLRQDHPLRFRQEKP